MTKRLFLHLNFPGVDISGNMLSVVKQRTVVYTKLKHSAKMLFRSSTVLENVAHRDLLALKIIFLKDCSIALKMLFKSSTVLDNIAHRGLSHI